MNDKETFSTLELQEALPALESTIGKYAKAEAKLRPGTSSHTLFTRLKALKIASSLIQQRREIRRLSPQMQPFHRSRRRTIFTRAGPWKDCS